MQVSGTPARARNDVGDTSNPPAYEDTRPVFVRPVSGLSRYNTRGKVFFRRQYFLQGGFVPPRPRFYPFVPIGERQLHDRDVLSQSLDMTMTKRVMQVFRANATTARIKMRLRVDPSVIHVGDDFEGEPIYAVAGPGSVDLRSPATIDLEPGNHIDFDINGALSPVATFSATPAVITGTQDDNPAWSPGPGDTLIFTIGSAPGQTVTLVGTETSAALLATAIQTQLAGLVTAQAVVSGDGFAVEVTTVKRGQGTEVVLECTGGTFAATCGLAAQNDTGTGNVADIDVIEWDDAVYGGVKQVLEAAFAGAATVALDAGTGGLIITNATVPAGSGNTIDIVGGVGNVDVALGIDGLAWPIAGVDDGPMLDPLWQSHDGAGTFSYAAPGRDAGNGAMSLDAGFLGSQVRYGDDPTGMGPDTFDTTAFGVAFNGGGGGVDPSYLSFWCKLDGVLDFQASVLVTVGWDGGALGRQTSTIEVPIEQAGVWEQKIVRIAAFGKVGGIDLFTLGVGGFSSAAVLIDDLEVRGAVTAAVFPRLVAFGATPPSVAWAVGPGDVIAADTYVGQGGRDVTVPPVVQSGYGGGRYQDIVLEQTWGVDTPLTVGNYYGIELSVVGGGVGTEEVQVCGSASGDRYASGPCGYSMDGGVNYTELSDEDAYFEIECVPAEALLMDQDVGLTWYPASAQHGGPVSEGAISGLARLHIYISRPTLETLHAEDVVFGGNPSLVDVSAIAFYDLPKRLEKIGLFGHTEHLVLPDGSYLEYQVAEPAHTSGDLAEDMDWERFSQLEFGVILMLAWCEVVRYG